MSKDFEATLAFGEMGERLVTEVLQSKGAGVVLSYQRNEKEDKAPRLLFASGGLVLPDIDACMNGDRFWLEIKTYHGPAWNMRHKTLVHGIQARHFEDYLLVASKTGTSVCVAVLELDSGHVLVRDLRKLSPLWPCQCHGCEARSGSCYARGKSAPKRGIYWPRASMKTWHKFTNNELAEIRSVHRRLLDQGHTNEPPVRQ